MGSDSSPPIVRLARRSRRGQLCRVGCSRPNVDGAAARQSSASGAASVERPSVKLRGACDEDPVAVGNGDIGPAEGSLTSAAHPGPRPLRAANQDEGSAPPARHYRDGRREGPSRVGQRRPCARTRSAAPLGRRPRVAPVSRRRSRSRSPGVSGPPDRRVRPVGGVCGAERRCLDDGGVRRVTPRWFNRCRSRRPGHRASKPVKAGIRMPCDRSST